MLPRFDNKPYLVVEEGAHFGHIDLAQELRFIGAEPDLGNAMRNNIQIADLMRLFTVQAFNSCDLLQLSISELFKMKLEFPKHFLDLFEGSRERLQQDLILKLEVIRET